MSNAVIEILTQLLTALNAIEICFIYYHIFSPRYFGKAATWFLYSALMWGGTFFFKQILVLPFPVYLVLMMAATIAEGMFLYEVSVKKMLIGQMLIYIIGGISEALAYFLTYLISRISYVGLYEAKGNLIIGKALIDIVFMIVAILFLLLLRINSFWKSGKIQSVLFFAVPFYQIILLIMFFSVCRNLTVQIIILCYIITVFSLFIDFMVFLAIENLNARISKEEELIFLEELRKKELYCLELYMKRAEEMRSIRHDLGNQLQTFSAMLEENADRNKIDQIVKELRRRLVNGMQPGEEGDK